MAKRKKRRNFLLKSSIGGMINKVAIENKLNSGKVSGIDQLIGYALEELKEFKFRQQLRHCSGIGFIKISYWNNQLWSSMPLRQHQQISTEPYKVWGKKNN